MNLQAARIIAFDNDGTLYPSGEEIGKIVLEAHRKYVAEHGLDLETPGHEWVKAMIGMDAKHFYPAMMPGQPPEVVKDFEDFCLDYETRAVFDNPGLYSGAHETLVQLKVAAKILVLVTNGGPRYVNSVWEAAGYGKYFAASYPFTAPEYETKGERLKQAIADWGGGPAVMVGDRESDKDAARFAGAAFIGCRYGYGAQHELDGADALIDSLSELPGLLLPTGVTDD